MAKKALLIGIDKYPEGYELSSCVNDVKCMSQSLRFNGDDQKSKNFDILIKKDIQDSQRALAYIEKLFAGDDEMALFYFSGHGSCSSIGAEIVFPNDLKSRTCYNGIQMDTLLKIVNGSNIKNKIIILDCCYSGAMANTLSPSSAVIRNGVSILTACRDSEMAVEGDDNGLFTQVLLQALDGGAADFSGNITVGGIYAYIDRSFGAWEQRPIFKTNVTEFAPIKTVKPRVSNEEMRELTSLFNNVDDLFKLDPSYEFTDPQAIQAHVELFQKLQKLQSIGFVEPVGEQFMYFAAMNSKACKLTTLGRYYWHLVAKGRI